MKHPTPHSSNTSPDGSHADRYKPVGLTPQQIVGAYSGEQWEDFIEEWTSSLNSKFVKVERISGSGDKGRDVICLESEPIAAGRWVNYQCKHYARPLMPSEIWLELGKLCYYTYIGDYPLPRHYRFVAPHDIGPGLHYLLNRPDVLRDELIKAWPQKCEKEITATVGLPLVGKLHSYVAAFDFGIVGYTPLNEVIVGHRCTPHWQERFQTALPKRPDFAEPPPSITKEEALYVAKLLAAYSDAAKRPFATVDELAAGENYHAHLKRSRRAFFRAEQLNRFSREIFAQGAFDKFKQQIMDGVADTVAGPHAHGLDRVIATTKTAAGLQLGNCELAPLVEVSDRHGACHHLANENKITWIAQ